MNIFWEQRTPCVKLHRVDCPACNPALHTYLENKSVTVNLPSFGLMTTEERKMRFSDTPVHDWGDEESLGGEFDVGPLGPCFNDPRYPEKWIGQWNVFQEKYDEGDQAPQRYSLHLFEEHRWLDVELPPISNQQEFEIVLNEAKAKFGFRFTDVAQDCQYPVIVPKFEESPSPARSPPEEQRSKKRKRETESPDPEERPSKRRRI